MSLSKNRTTDPHPGDWVQARGLPGQGSRHGQIIEVLGRPGHERYRVRWDERHESIVFPADGVSVTPGRPTPGREAGRAVHGT